MKHAPLAALTAPFLRVGILAPADVYAVSLSADRFGEDDPLRMFGLAFAVRAPRTGQSGVLLDEIAARIEDEHPRGDGDEAKSLRWPKVKGGLMARTLMSPMVGAPDDVDRPFVRQQADGRTILLTRRMYEEQARVAKALAARLIAPELDDVHARAHVARLFAAEPDGEAARAVALALRHRLAIVAGGPGTGKTYSISRLLAALVLDEDPHAPLQIALAAPTGKAAARMVEALREAIADPKALSVPQAVHTRLQGMGAQTLHRLIGIRPDGSARHHAENPIGVDVVVVDEVSMVDLTLMRRLLEATPPDARLILLGDRDQLASVEAGCVLSDLVSTGALGPLRDRVQTFSRSRRFASAPDIALIAACLQSLASAHPEVPGGDTEGSAAARTALAQQVLCGQAHSRDERFPGRRVAHLGEPERPAHGGARPSHAQLDALAAPWIEGVCRLDAGARAGESRPGSVDSIARSIAYVKRGPRTWADEVFDPIWQRGVLACLDAYRVLCVHRRGALGVERIDQALAERLQAAIFGEATRRSGLFVGRPILVTENAYDLGLMNGDAGVVLPAPGGGLHAVFAHEDPARVRAVPVARLPAHEGALAMTVHKAQGSQFERVALVLAGRRSAIETRELIYTAITRAKDQLVWLGTSQALAEALERRIDRVSGLPALLHEQTALSATPRSAAAARRS